MSTLSRVMPERIGELKGGVHKVPWRSTQKMFSPDASAGQWVLAVALVVLYTVALSWVGVATGLSVSGPEAASGMTFVLLFLPYVSSAFVPVATLPGWMQGFARHMPITPVTDAVRDLLSGRHPGTFWVGVAWCVAVLLVGRVWAALVWRRGA